MTDFPHDPPATGQPTDATVRDKAADVASTGKQAAGEVAQTAAGGVRDVAEQTKQQAGDLFAKTRDQLNEQAAAQQRSVVDSLRDLGGQLAAMTEHADTSGTAVDLAARARDRARDAADWLDAREPGEVLDDARQLGRDRPGAFLLGAALAGVVAGRLTRGVVTNHSDQLGSSAPSQRPADARSAAPSPIPATPTPSPSPSPRPASAADHETLSEFASDEWRAR